MALITAGAVIGVGLTALPSAAAAGGAPAECSGTMGTETVSAVDVPQDAACTLDGTTVNGDVVVGIDATLTTTDATTINGSVHMPVDCTGALDPTIVYYNVVVPDGASCTLNGVTVLGMVRVGVGSSLFTNNSTIDGNVQAVNGPATVQVIDTNIGLSVNISEATGPIVVGSAGCAVDPTVGVDVILHNNHGTIALCYLTVGNTIDLQGNTANIGVFHNEIGNALNIQANTGRYVRARYNHVGFSGGGGINLQDNTGQGVLRRNNVGNAVNCSGNTLTPIGGGNTAGSGLNGQCASLG